MKCLTRIALGKSQGATLNLSDSYAWHQMLWQAFPGQDEDGESRDFLFRKKGRRSKLVAVDFSGMLTVTDRDAFMYAFNNGIGTAKAFGFGMLMLQPIQ